MLAEGDDIQPSSFGDEGEVATSWLWPGFDIFCGTCLEEQSDIVGVDLTSCDQNLEAHHQNERDFVLLEQTSVDVFVDVLGQELDDDLHSLCWRLHLIGVINGLVEQHQELLERAVVHPIHQRHLNHGEVQCRTPNSHRPILLSLIVNLLRLGLGISQLHSHFLGLRLRAIEHLHQFGIIQQVSFTFCEALQQVLVELLELFLVVVDVGQQGIQGVLEGFLLFRDDLTQQLLFETFLGDCEVDDGGLGRELWGEGGVGQPARQEHQEVLVEVHIGSSDLDDTPGLLPHNLLLQHWIEHGIHLILNTLNHNGLPLLQTILQEVVLELRVVQIGQRPILIHRIGVFLHDPVLSLTLWINQQWITSGVRDHDTILDGQVVLG